MEEEIGLCEKCGKKTTKIFCFEDNLSYICEDCYDEIVKEILEQNQLFISNLENDC